MSQPRHPYSANLLLQSLSDADLDRLKPHLSRSTLAVQQVLVTAGQPIEHLYFLEGGIASVVSNMADAGQTEVGIFGREGMSGTAVILGAETTGTTTFIQVDGSTALRLGVAEFRGEIEASPTLRASLLRYVQTVFVQVSNSAVSNLRHPLEARLARWLLMCHDRTDGDEILLTHEFMAIMIGAQRTGVTVTLHILEGGGSIRSKRGRVIILDRGRLEELAGEAYGRPEAEYRKLIGPFGRKVN